jgi:hypothetical protein
MLPHVVVDDDQSFHIRRKLDRDDFFGMVLDPCCGTFLARERAESHLSGNLRVDHHGSHSDCWRVNDLRTVPTGSSRARTGRKSVLIRLRISE